MSRIIRPVLLAIFVLVLTTSPSFSADYLQSISDAISGIQLGNYDSAASSVEKALAVDDVHPLGHMALGTIYMQTSRLADAEREFRRVLSVKSGYWQANYALGVIAAVKGRTQDADRYFTAAAKQPESLPEVSAYRMYRAYLEGRIKSIDAKSVPSIPLAQEVAAMVAMKSGKRDQAIMLFSQIVRSPSLGGFQEARAPLAAFSVSGPISLPKGKLTWKPANVKNAPTVSGVVSLAVNTQQSETISFISLYVDDTFIGVTNCQPPQFDWDSRNYPNGLHKIRMEGMNESGSTVSVKTVVVRVKNSQTKILSAVKDTEIIDLTRRLWQCIRVSESRKLAHYYLAKLCAESGNREDAVKHLEFAVAYQPDLLDARTMLKNLGNRNRPYSEIHRGPQGQKLIALTFDDGPNERTAELLEMLAKLDVKATFFLVGMVSESQPDLVKAIMSGGHEIENHTYSHIRLNTLDTRQVESELARGAAVIRAITGKPSLYFRPPGGHSSEATKQAAARLGLTGVFWTVLCSPYEGSNNAELASHVLKTACDGAVILMHNGEPATVSSLPRIVDELRSQGYRFVTLSELAASPQLSGKHPAHKTS